MLKKQCLLYFSILIFKYIFFARHIALGLTQHTSFPLTKRFPVAFKIYLRLCFLANLWSQGNLSVFGTEPLTAFQNMSPPLVKEIHYHQPAHRWLTSVAQQLLCPGKYVERQPRYSH